MPESPTAAAERIIRDHLVDENGLYTVPVDPARLAKAMKIEVEEAALERSVAGLIVKVSREAPVKILLNRSDADVRKRFTCAHELGHFVKREASDGDGLIGFVDYRNEMSGTGLDSEEVWANQFAAALLMPANAVKTLWESGSSVGHMANTFGVSRQAMDIRVSTLNLA